jgi:hypothetical protein
VEGSVDRGKPYIASLYLASLFTTKVEAAITDKIREFAYLWKV